MKIGVLSDTHDAVQLVDMALDYFEKNQCDAIFHAGDFVSPFAFDKLRRFSGPVYAVFGNNEAEKVAIRNKGNHFPCLFLEDEILTAEFGGKRILMKHRDCGVYDLAASDHYDLVIYGHTHRIEEKWLGNTLLVNPGECCGCVTGHATVALVDLETMKVHVEKIY